MVWNPKVRQRFLNTPLLVDILTELESVHALTSYFS